MNFIASHTETVKIAFRHIEHFRYDEAVSAFDILIDESPDISLLLWRAQCLIAVERYEDALNDNFRVLYLDRGNAHACLNLALIYSAASTESLRDCVKARQYIDRYLKETNDQTTWRILSLQAAVDAECGDFESAVQFAESSKNLAPVQMHERCDARIQQYRQRKPFRCTKNSILEALNFRQHRCEKCGEVAFYRSEDNNGGMTPVCNDCNWGPEENAG